MTIYYQGVAGAYSHITSMKIQKIFGLNDSEIVGLSTFRDVWDHIDNQSIAVLPIENSYAGSIHENIYGFLRYPYHIIGEYYLPIDHCLLGKTQDLNKIKKVYSHPQALAQCHDFLLKHTIEAIPYADTAKSSEFVAQHNDVSIASIASSLAGKRYDLHIIQQGIQDQKENTTRFIVVANDHVTKRLTINDKTRMHTIEQSRTILIFQTHHIPAALYKCLGAFATNNINLTKLESIPTYHDPFSYNFWIECDSTLDTKAIQHALDELRFFTKSVRVLTG